MSPLPRRGRAGYGRVDQSAGTRSRRASQSLVSDAELDNATLERDSRGRTRIKALDGLKQLPANASLASVVSQINRIQKMLQGL